jgi:hypothetical protein
MAAIMLLSCTERNIGNDSSIELLQKEFINANLIKLEYLSGKYDYFEEAVIELEKGLFSMDREKIGITYGRLNLVQTDETTITIAKLILPSFARKNIGEDFFTFASKFKNLWIVRFQSKTFEKANFDPGSAVIVISKHTAEVLMISY